jgi:hypothetical protein
MNMQHVTSNKPTYKGKRTGGGFGYLFLIAFVTLGLVPG